MRAGELMTVVAVQGAVAAGMVEALIRLWRVEAPERALQLRRLALALPVLASGLAWGAAGLGVAPAAPALFAVRPWLQLVLPGGLPLGLACALVGALTAGLFVAQELAPALVRRGEAGRGARPYRLREIPALDAGLASVSATFGGLTLPVWIAADGGPVACVAGPWRPRLLVSRRLVGLLDPPELVAALAHEAAHTLRRDLRAGWAWFGLRALQCFSPAALLEYRLALRDQESACDWVAAARTGDAPAMASALRKVHAATPSPRPAGGLRHALARAEMAWEERLLRQRLALLARERPPPPPEWRWRLGTAALAIGGVLMLVR